jgi:hypothetical protein
MGEDGEDRLNILARVTTAPNTNLEGATVELDKTHEKLLEAQARIAQLEAQIAGVEPPPAEEDDPPSSILSPPRKRLHYGPAGSITSLLG